MILCMKDCRIVIDSFLDFPSLHALLLAFKFESAYGCKQKYSAHVKRSLVKKRRQCCFQWNFHVRMPDELRKIENMHKFTKQNLWNLSNLDFSWNPCVYTWLIPRGTSKPGSDMMLRGTHPQYGIVQFWRHETKHPGAGQTLLVWYEGKKKKRIQVHKYIRSAIASRNAIGLREICNFYVGT